MRTHRLGQGVLAVCLLIVCQFGFAKPRDPAPIPDEVLQKLVANHPTEARDELAENLSAQVTETEQLARELTTELYRDAAAAGKGGRASAAEGKQAQLMGKRSEWLNWRGEVERRVEQAKAELLDRGLTDQADAWSRHAAQLENRFRDLDEAFARLDRSVDRRQRRDAAVALKSLLRGLGPRSDAGQLPLESQQIHTVAPPPEPTPQQETDEIPQYLSDQRRVAENLYAYAGDLLLAAAPVTPPEATSCSYTSADLAATSDAPQTPEIQALAKSLDYSPRKIYQYVYNEIAFELYYGSLKGAQGTLLAKAGGSTDQASLLIALLRASNIPSRYVKGQIWVLDQTPAPVDGRAPRWVGAKSYTAAGKILATGYNPVAGAISTALGQGITATQVWGEACVPYGHYRGVPLDNAGHRWIPMDPSFKDMRYQPGIANNVTFDATGYLAQRTFELPHEWYERQVDAAIKGANPAVMLWDAPYRGEIEPRPLDILPASLPYLVSGFRSWAGTTSPETAELPASHRYQLDVNVNGTTLTSATLALPQVALSRVSLSFKGATAADQTALDAWRNDGNLGSALTCGNVVHVTPVVKVDGAEQTPAATPAAVDVCSTTNSLTLTVSLPELTNPVVNIAPFKTIAAANIDVLAFYARQSSDALLTHRVVRLLNAVTATANPNANLEETEGELLNLIGLKYFRHVADSRQYIAGLDGGSGDSGPMLGRVSSGSKVVYLFDLPFAVVRSAFVVDIPSALDSNLDLTSGQLVWKTYQETGYQDSSLEHYIWQENLRMEAISTVRGLQVANETGVGTVQVNAANWAAVRPLLSVYPGASASDCTYSLGSLQYPRCIIDDTARPNSTASLVSLGHTVTLPVSLLQYGSYKGWVQMAERQTANAADSGMCAIA
ncbi:MAG: hypothetical protein FIA97_09540, partial [Methylococcaceae bacterium]|nr:hypothetical protein [Methylococcaceae bacterium]